MRKQYLQYFVKQMAVAVMVFVFSYTALSKLVEWRTAIVFLKKSPFAPIAEQLAILIPAAELFIAVLLIIPATRLKALYASFVLMVLFTLYIGYMLLFYPDRPCNCGGVINTMSWEAHIVFNLLLIALTGLAIKWFHIKEVDQPGKAENPNKRVGTTLKHDV